MKKELLSPQDQYLTQAINLTGFCIQVEKSPLTMCAGIRLANSSMYNNEVMNFHVCIRRSKYHQAQCIWVLDLSTARYRTVIQLIQCVVLFCVQMQNLDHDPVDMKRMLK